MKIAYITVIFLVWVQEVFTDTLSYKHKAGHKASNNLT